jgi:hypothetical protein
MNCSRHGRYSLYRNWDLTADLKTREAGKREQKQTVMRAKNVTQSEDEFEHK